MIEDAVTLEKNMHSVKTHVKNDTSSDTMQSKSPMGSQPEAVAFLGPNLSERAIARLILAGGLLVQRGLSLHAQVFGSQQVHAHQHVKNVLEHINCRLDEQSRFNLKGHVDWLESYGLDEKQVREAAAIKELIEEIGYASFASLVPPLGQEGESPYAVSYRFQTEALVPKIRVIDEPEQVDIDRVVAGQAEASQVMSDLADLSSLDDSVLEYYEDLDPGVDAGDLHLGAQVQTPAQIMKMISQISNELLLVKRALKRRGIVLDVDVEEDLSVDAEDYALEVDHSKA
jgi:hypothetical protein